jgi:ectoine hydroxylase-related dioxygenase (phytanoyl-CoA dioxygenase family)
MSKTVPDRLGALRKEQVNSAGQRIIAAAQREEEEKNVADMVQDQPQESSHASSQVPSKEPRSIDFEQFHRIELPRLLDAGRGLEAAKAIGKKSLAFRLTEGGAFTYRPKPAGVEIVEGDDSADTIIELSHSSWEGIVNELDTGPGLIYGGRVKCPRGNSMHLIEWDPGLRAMYNGRRIFDPDEVDLRDLQGEPLNTEQSFRPDADRSEMAHFLKTAGFLIAREVFSKREVAGFLDDAAALHAGARPGDKLSWWGKNAHGDETLCRVTNAGIRPRLQALYDDTRVAQLVALSDEKLTARAATSDQGVSVIFKNPDMKEGLSDIPWHRDCGMGGHAAMCPVLIVSIYLSDANDETGDLRMLPGSWQRACGFIDARHPDAPSGVGVNGRPGDVSLHYGDVMHAAPPPTGPGPYRTSVIMAFVKDGVRNHRGGGSYNDVLLSRDDGQVEHLADLTKRS